MNSFVFATISAAMGSCHRAFQGRENHSCVVFRGDISVNGMIDSAYAYACEMKIEK
jgi:hypothetical protein